MNGSSRGLAHLERLLRRFAVSALTRWDDPHFSAMCERSSRMREGRRLGVQTASSLTPVNTTWIYKDFLPVNEFTIAYGGPGVGKTTLVCFFAAGVTRGPSFPLANGLTSEIRGHVIIINTEDDLSATLLTRLKAANANLDMVHFIKCNAGSGCDSSFSFANDQDLDRLAGYAEILDNNVALIVVDPIYSAVDGDQNNAFKAREAYERMPVLAKRFKCAVLGIAHDVKNPHGKEPLARLAGPPALREVPRSIMLLKEITNGPTEAGGTHILVHAKNNNGRMDGGFEYRIQEAEIPGPSGPVMTLRFEITGELFGSAVSLIKNSDHPNKVETTSKLEAAVIFLRKVLKDGPLLRSEIDELAEKYDVKPATMINAKNALKMVTKKRNGDGRSVWSLPESIIDHASLSGG